MKPLMSPVTGLAPQAPFGGSQEHDPAIGGDPTAVKRRGDENYNIMVKLKPGVLVRQAQADVDIIAGHPKLRIESSDGEQMVPAIGAVASGDVLRVPVGQQYMDRATWSIGDRVRD